ncbi:MAG: 4-hydroxy-3-methylbut-2-enyl diphosphate reductase [bacterium]|nr:4-hydroxy-3-methylbut-2-enyl diphosphate reductase [bacterium]
MKKFNIKTIHLASPRGFCAGVERAVDILGKVLERYGPPVYSRHAIVHNRRVVSDFEKKGAIFVEDIHQIPDGSRVVFSAHGSPPEFYEIAKQKNFKLFDAMCPLVLKVHIEAKKYASGGYYIFYIGHRGHPEPEGVMGNVKNNSIKLIGSETEALNVKPPQEDRLIVLTQTTLSFDDTKKIIETLKKRFSKLILPPAFDICYATQNRQVAVKSLSKKVEVVIIIGSPASSNSNRLREVAEREGRKSYMIDSTFAIKDTWFENVENVGISAGASSPENLVNEVIDYIKNKDTKIFEEHVIKEKVYFPRPNSLN